MNQIQTVRNPPPRMLTSSESLYSLQHWITSFRTYYQRDSYYKSFLLPQVRWESTQAHYGQVDDVDATGTVTRTAEDKSEDLKDFLNTIVGYLPFPYLTEKILHGTKKLQDVWDSIYEHFGLNITGETLLDFANMQISTGETYRQFYDRLLAHTRLHLAKPNVVVDGISSGTQGEVMSISLMNLVALQWLQKIDAQLVDIVKLEYSKELRDSQQLASLVPRIANNIDAMLSRHNIIGAVDKVSIQGEPQVNKLSFKPKQSDKSKKKKNNPFCPECHYLSKKLSLKVDTQHFPSECPRPRAAVRLLLAEVDDQDSNDDEDVDFTGKNSTELTHANPKIIQRNFDNSVTSSCVQSVPVVNVSHDMDLLLKVLAVTNHSSIVRRESSPQLRVSAHNIHINATIDEGSEINCICASVAAQMDLTFTPINLQAKAAGSYDMQLLGKLKEPLSLRVSDTKKNAFITLVDVVVVKRLGPSLLIGEPGKMDNHIVTIPAKKVVQLQDVLGNKLSIPYNSNAGEPKKDFHPLVNKNQKTLYPGESIELPIHEGMRSSVLQVTTRRNAGFEMAEIKKVDDRVVITNTLNELITIPKMSHVIDTRACYKLDLSQGDTSINKLCKIYDVARDHSHLLPSKGQLEETNSYLNDISIDPDGVMPKIWKTRFKQLCTEYSNVITPVPGRYNGAFGRTSTDINFTSTPPSNQKTYIPKYSHEMMTLLASKMDKLEQWGVLRKPEELGIVPEFVVPSMLTPKAEKNEFRLVTDFTSLNKYIKKLPTISPNIQEAKQKIAKFKYHVFLDLSNYYYQGGVTIQDSQYLATVHPFKGLMVYTGEPQGLLNSGEHTYERLGRIFGDMCAK